MTSQSPAAPPRRAVAARILGLVIAALGLALAVGGVRLLALGGTAYFALAGAGLLLSGMLLMRARAWGVGAYLIVFAASLAWSWGEGGGNLWAMIPRAVAPALFAVLVLLVAPQLVVGRTFRLAALTGAALLVLAGGGWALWLAAPERAAVTQAGAPAQAPLDWPAYGGAPGGGQFSAAAQITPANVGRLAKAWEFHTGERGEGLAVRGKLTFETNPVVVDGRLYASTATDTVFALDAVSGRPLWRFDPRISRAAHFTEASSRGVSLWRDPTAAPAAACAQRVVFGTLDARLIALDAADGRPCEDFGAAGAVDLKAGARVNEAPDYVITSPPAIVGDVAVVGSGIGDNGGVRLARGIVRGFDLRTGRVRWTWDPVPATPELAARLGWRPEQAEATGAANAWAPISADPARGLVFVPTGSPSPDFWGGDRIGADADANSVVALRAATGEVAWRRQLVHHDLWDYDTASQPVLATLPIGGRPRDVVLTASKAGFLFVLDRDTGAPVFPVEERAVPRSDAPGETASPTQPFPTAAFRLSHTGAMTSADAWGFTPLDQLACALKVAGLRSQGMFTPPSRQGTIELPGYGGGLNWGGLAVDPARGIGVAAVMDVAMVVTLVDRAPTDRWAAMRRSGRFPHSEFAPMTGAPVGLRREMLASPLGAPCTRPPWGRLVGIDLKRGALAWSRPLGTTGRIMPVALPLGAPLMGGPSASAGGVTFVAATTDSRLRAFETASGRKLWETALPAGGQATPSVFAAGGRQFLVIAAGGHGRLGLQRGDSLVAYALP